MGEQVHFITSNAVSLFLLEISFACNPAFYFNMGKTTKTYIILLHMFLLLQKHPNNDLPVLASNNAFVQ